MKRAHTSRLTTALAVLPALSILPAASIAQDNDGRLDEITVTSERREASIQDVPLAVSAYNEESIQTLQIDETLDLVNLVPNLFGGNNTGLGTANMYYMRGQGNDESIATFDPPVGTYVDDVYITRQNANNFSFFDVERIEVLRGPQGTLFGRNTTGGAINIILKKPGEEMGGYVEAGFGRFSETLVRGSIDMPLSDKVLTKFSAFINESDGWLDNSVDGNEYNGKDNFGVRAAFRFLPSDEVTWDLAIDYMDTEEANVLGQIQGSRRVSGSILPNGILPIPGFEQKASDYGNVAENLNVTSDLSFEAGAGTANLIIGYRSLEQEFLVNFPGLGSEDFFWIDNVGEHDMFSAEFKWNALLFDDRVNLVTGVYYMDEDNRTDFADYVFTAVRLADRVLTNTTESLAVYAQADISVGENGTLTLGARFTDEEKTVDFFDNTGGSLTTMSMMQLGIPTSQDESQVTPRIAYAHQFNDDTMWYISATNGFKAGGWNARGATAAELLPFGAEEIWSYETGVRTDLLDGRLRVNATVFYNELEDLQTTSATPSGAFLTTNAGGLETPGAEFEITALPTDNWQIFLALGFQDAEYVDLPTGCVAPNTDFAAFDIDCNVADPKRSPDTTWTLSSTYDIPLPSLGATLRPTVSGRYIGRNVVGTRQLGINGSEFLVNANIALIDDEDRWTATVECQNCSDEEYFLSFLFGEYFTEPMAWMARFRYNFGN